MFVCVLKFVPLWLECELQSVSGHRFKTLLPPHTRLLEGCRRSPAAQLVHPSFSEGSMLISVLVGEGRSLRSVYLLFQFVHVVVLSHLSVSVIVSRSSDILTSE